MAVQGFRGAVQDEVDAKAAHSDSLLVAIIEDELDVRAMSRLLLQHWGNETIEASNGQRGIELVRERADAIDIVLVDIGLPDMAGYDVARVLQEILGDRCPPLVAVTGWGQDRDRELAMAAGFDAHLGKPVSPKALVETIARLARG